jgi:transposase
MGTFLSNIRQITHTKRLKKVAGVSVSESTLSRVIRKMGFGRKKGRWVRVSGTSS